MKTCHKCNKLVPKNIVIDGKKKNLQNRKFCLECSPFGSHNTKPDDPSRISTRGQTGGKAKPYSTWTEEAKTKSRLTVWQSGFKRKQQLVDMKGGSCKSCGYKKCLRALSFHHRDPSQKQFALDMRSIRGMGWETVLQEAEKCDLYCLNCHQEIEDKIAQENGKYYKFIS